MIDLGRLKRARSMGFNVLAHHGTKAEFNEFDMEKGRGNHSGFAPFFANKRDEASGYADEGRILDVMLRIRKPLIIPSTWGVMPRDYKKISLELYKTITGGVGPDESKKERYLTPQDAIEHAMDVHYQATGNYDRKAIWKGIYSRLIAQGYDAIIWKDTPSDHGDDPHYDKIVMLDMTGIRLITAEFDPTKSGSKNIRD